MRLDKLDRQLIAVLKEDGRMPYRQLADRLDVAEGTARNRLQRLISSGAVRVTPIVDHSKVGYRLNVFIGVRCQTGALRRVARAFAEYHAVRYVAASTGAYDVVCEAVFLSQSEMLSFLEKDLATIDGIVETQTSVVLDIAKLGYTWELREEDEVELEAGEGPPDASQ